MAEESSTPPASRRRFLEVATLALGGAVGLALSVPLVRYFFFPVGRKVVSSPDAPIDVCALSAVPADGTPVQVAVVADAQRDAWSVRERVAVGSAWVRRDKGGKVVALSAQCPHLGCSIGYDGQRFRCPCHKSSFKPTGERESGPSKRGLDPLPVEVVDGRVRLRFVRYRPDVAERIEV
jgi:menaquinol-cytochrome c reductase iron-sulfur subunit